MAIVGFDGVSCGQRCRRSRNVRRRDAHESKGVDRYGARRLLLVATGLIVVGLLGVSRIHSFSGVLVSYRLVTATGFGIAIVISYVAPIRWFERRRGFAVGIATAGAGIGTLLVPLIVEWAIEVIGWRAAYASLTTGFVILFGLATLLLADWPQDIGLDRSVEFPNGVPRRPSTVASWWSQIADIVSVARSPTFVQLFFAYILISAPAGVLLVNIVEYTTSTGIGRTTGVLAIPVLGVMNMVGKVAGGPVVDRIGSIKTIATSGVLGGLVESPVRITSAYARANRRLFVLCIQSYDHGQNIRGSEREFAFLKDQFSTGDRQLLVLYGCRRVGKTALVSEFLKRQEREYVYFLADQRGTMSSAERFANQCAQSFDDVPPAVEGFDDVFEYVVRRIDDELILVIDEFSYLVEKDDSVPSVFQRIHDDILADTDVSVILLGSSISMMEEGALSHESPLYGRLTYNWNGAGGI